MNSVLAINAVLLHPILKLLCGFNFRYTKWYKMVDIQNGMKNINQNLELKFSGGKVSKAIQFSRTAKKSLCYENQAFATVDLSSVVTKRDLN